MADPNSLFPDATTAPGGSAPSAFILHHTAGRGDPASVVKFWQQQGKGYGAQYIMDRNGVIHDTQKEFGYNGSNEILNDPAHKLYNGNVVGMEIIANDDRDVTPQQAQAAAQFIQTRYPNTPLFGHGQVNPGHKEPTEGATALNAAIALRSQNGVPALGTSINVSNPANQGPESVGQGAPSAAATGPQDPRQIVFSKLTRAGLSPQAALGALWSLGGEGGAGLDPRSYNANDPGGSIGYGQWNGVRRTALENFAKTNGTSWADPNTQADHIVNELTNKDYASYQPGVFAALQAAKTPEEAASIWTGKFERPQVDNSAQRIKGGPQVATLDANGNLALGSAQGGGPAPGTVPGTTITSTPPAVASAASPAGVLPGFPDKATSDDFTKGATALDKAWHGDQSGGQEGGQGAAPMAFPPARNVSPLLPLSSQIYGNTLTSMATPLQWSSAPPGQSPYAGGGAAIGQQFGTQLSSIEQMRQMMAMGSPYGDAGYG